MPAYDFVCEGCRNEFEIWGTVAEYSKGLVEKCPFCGGAAANHIPEVSFVVSQVAIPAKPVKESPDS